MNNRRAPFDQKVIDAWAAQISRNNRGLGRAQLFMVLALLLDVAFVYFSPNGFTVFMLFAIGAALAIAQVLETHSLRCPHCKRRPISVMQRGTGKNADFCVHCHYWLKSPYARHDDAQV